MNERATFIRICLGSLLFLSLIILISTSTCAGKIQESSVPSTYWHIDFDGVIMTNDLQRLQEEIPFTILIPDYLPDEFKNHTPDFRYSTSSSVFSDAISVFVIYATIESPHSIDIKEYIPGIEYTIEAPVWIDIKGLKVAEWSWKKPLSVQEELMQDVNHYQWISDSVYFSVYVYSYSQDEARKIIESIIK